MKTWEHKAAESILREWDRIDGEAIHAGQVAQDPRADHDLRVDEIAKVIREAYDKCPQCGGNGKSWYAFRGFDSCDRCLGTGVRR